MKTLQNNFTTPEQSKRLLELGVPADSADCYQVPNGLFQHPYVLVDLFSKTDFIPPKNEVLPCWSVGRLIELMLICCSDDMVFWKGNPVMDSLYHDVVCQLQNSLWDFSRLEE